VTKSKLATWRRKASGLPLSLLASALICSGAVASGLSTGPSLHSLDVQHVPQAIAAAQAPRVAALAVDQHLQLALSLPTRNQAELDGFLQQLQDPTSTNYHQYLSVEEYTERFGPSKEDYEEVVSWAQAHGLTVTGTTPNRRLVDVDGDVNTVNQTFHVSMGSYQHPTEARQFFAPDREPTVDLAVPLLSISGLNNYVLPSKHLKQGDLSRAIAAGTRTTGSGPSGQFLPSDMRAAYYGSGSLTGSGQTIGIFSFDGYKAADVTLFYTKTGMSSSVPITNVLVGGFSGTCQSPCDDGEQILDIVNAIGMAPGITKVLFYEGNSATDIMNKMVTDNSAKILSCSWYGNDFNNPTDDPIYQEMAAQGQTFVNASGDDGAYNSQAWGAPSADPYVLEIGGTDLTTTGAGGPWASETGWADSGGGYYSGAGESTPAYQKLAGVITTTNKGSTTYRNDPDVSAEANFDNPTVSNGVLQSGYGGTSFAAPRWAGFLALANQQSIANGHGPVGLINTAIYNAGLSASYHSEFHDVTSGSNPPTVGSGPTFNAVAGFDLVTGWGSPTAALIPVLAGGTTATPDFSLSAAPNSVSIAQGGNGTSTVTINKLNGFASSVNLSASGLPSGVTASFSPASATTTSTLTLTASASATAGTSTVTISGTSGSLTHTTTVSVTVTATAQPNFALSASPNSLSITQGANGTSIISVTDQNGFSGSVSLAASGLPAGVTAAFSPASTSTSSTLTLSASASATTGPATVTITGTSGSLSHTTTISLTVNATTGGNVLTNGVPVTGLSAAKGAQLLYTMAVPAGASNLKFTIAGGTGDADMYVRFGSAPTLTTYDCRPYVSGNSETCTIPAPQVGTYYVMLNAYAAFSGLSLTGSYSTTSGNVLTNGVAVSGLQATTGNNVMYTMAVPAGETTLVFQISGGTGDADLYVRRGSAPTTSTYDCRPYLSGNSETCTINSPVAGTFYVMVNAYASYTGVTLKGTWSP
jgi:subtilase family serine protease